MLKLGTQGLIDILLFLLVLLEVAADESEGSQHFCKLRVLINLALLDVLSKFRNGQWTNLLGYGPFSGQ